MVFINVPSIIIVILMLLPNVIYAYKNKNLENKCTNKLINVLEQIGRYASMFFMIVNIKILEFGWKHENSFSFWIIFMAALLMAYWVVWLIYFKKPKIIFAMLLAIIPSAIFVLSGVFLGYGLLVISGVIFSFGHIWVTYKNR